MIRHCRREHCNLMTEKMIVVVVVVVFVVERRHYVFDDEVHHKLTAVFGRCLQDGRAAIHSHPSPTQVPSSTREGIKITIINADCIVTAPYTLFA